MIAAADRIGRPSSVSAARRAADIVDDAAEMPLEQRWRFIFACYETAADELKEAIVAMVIVAQAGAMLRAGGVS